MELTSTKNARLAAVRRAVAAGRETEDGLIVAEGPHLVEEALGGAWEIEQILVTPEARERHVRLVQQADCEIVDVAPRAFASLAATETTQGILALLRPAQWEWANLTSGPALVVALDGVQDPGNAGAIVRSAEAFGATGVVFAKGGARVANGKLLRATAGSIFRVPYLEGMNTRGWLAEVRERGMKLYALTPRGGRPVTEADFRVPCALAVGSEASGLSSEVAAEAESVRIPSGKVESLNAAISCSIALWVAQQQRAEL